MIRWVVRTSAIGVSKLLLLLKHSALTIAYVLDIRITRVIYCVLKGPVRILKHLLLHQFKLQRKRTAISKLASGHMHHRCYSQVRCDALGRPFDINS